VGSRLKEDEKEFGVNTVQEWCNTVKARGWLASKMGEGNEERKEEDDSGDNAVPEFSSTSHPKQLKFVWLTCSG